MNRKKFRFSLSLGLVMSLLLLTVGCGSSNQPTAAIPSDTNNSKPKTSTSPNKEIVIAEPLHSIGYLPLYIAIKKGFFDGVNVKVTTLAGGGAHTNAVLTGQAWGFIGGPEHNAFAKAKGADIRAVVNVVNRGNVYFVASPGLSLEGGDIKTFLKGKTIVTGAYGGTPNSITRYVLAKAGLDLQKDVKLKEVDNAAIPAIIKEKQGDIATLR
jgi:NitT/TauT family transport system substrate-binding protein